MPKEKRSKELGEPRQISCHDCGAMLRHDCYCPSCRCYFARVRLLRDVDKWEWVYGGEPERACSACGYRLKLDGFCWPCGEFRAARLIYTAYKDGLRVWAEDSLEPDRRCTKEENLHELHELRKMLAKKGTPMSRAMLAAVSEDALPF